MTRTCQTIFLTLIVVIVFTSNQPINAQVKPLSGIEQLHRLDLLPTFKPSVKIGSVSSYDRTGGNDDGFNGTYSYLRKEANGLVIADLKGPGIIYRIWTPTPTDDIVEFYFDGETTARIRVKFRDLFSGKEFPFLSPVVGTGAGGFYSYLPLAYKKSCKVLVKTPKIEFYQINFATYADNAGIETYTANSSNEFKENLEKARKFLASTGADISSYAVTDNQKLTTRNFNGTLAAGKTVRIFETNKAGRIVKLKLAPASAFANKERDTLIKIFWDGDANPAIVAPVGDFFGYAWGEPAVKSLLLGTIDDTNYIYLPMPFDKSARIELVSEKISGAPIDVSAEIKFADVGRKNDEGKFYALWRRENLTTEGRPYTFLETRSKYSCTISSVMLPVLHAPYPIAQKWLPQYRFSRCAGRTDRTHE